MPEYDNTILAYADRTRILNEAHKAHLAVENGMRATVLVDGFARASWSVVNDGKKASLVIAPFERLRRDERASLVGEGERLLAFMVPEAAKRVIEIRAV